MSRSRRRMPHVVSSRSEGDSLSASISTLSVLFTDLVDSTKARIALGEEAADELRRIHDQMLADAVERNGGFVVKGMGDGIMATFTAAAQAVAAAVEIQHAADSHSRAD